MERRHSIPFVDAYRVAHNHIITMRRLRWSYARIAEQVNLPATASRDEIMDRIADRWLECQGFLERRQGRAA